jgi:hypothetical protein
MLNDESQHHQQGALSRNHFDPLVNWPNGGSKNIAELDYLFGFIVRLELNGASWIILNRRVQDFISKSTIDIEPIPENTKDRRLWNVLTATIKINVLQDTVLALKQHF